MKSLLVKVLSILGILCLIVLSPHSHSIMHESKVNFLMKSCEDCVVLRLSNEGGFTYQSVDELEDQVLKQAFISNGYTGYVSYVDMKDTAFPDRVAVYSNEHLYISGKLDHENKDSAYSLEIVDNELKVSKITYFDGYTVASAIIGALLLCICVFLIQRVLLCISKDASYMYYGILVATFLICFILKQFVDTNIIVIMVFIICCSGLLQYKLVKPNVAVLVLSSIIMLGMLTKEYWIFTTGSNLFSFLNI